MKKPLKVFLVGIGLILLITLVIGLMLPSEWEAEASVEIIAPTSKIHPYISSFKGWESWATEAMQREDASTEVTFSGPESGPGATMSWTGEKMGTGRLTILESDPDRGIEYEAAIQGDEVNAHGWVRYEKTEDGTRVTWHDGGDLPPFIGGFLAAQVNEALNEHFETSLNKLKEKVESD